MATCEEHTGHSSSQNLRQEDAKFKAGLQNLVRPLSKTNSKETSGGRGEYSSVVLHVLNMVTHTHTHPIQPCLYKIKAQSTMLHSNCSG